MESSIVEDDIREAYVCAKGFFQQGDIIKALEITEEAISVYGRRKSSAILYWLQGTIFSRLARETEDNYVKCTYLVSALELSIIATILFPGCLEFIHFCANSMFNMGKQLASKHFYESALFKAKEGLFLENPEDNFEYPKGSLNRQERIKDLKQELVALIELAEEKMNLHAENSPVAENKPNSRLTSRVEGQTKTIKSECINAVAENLRSFWAGMSIRGKKNFMAVDIKKLKCYVEGLYGILGREALQRGLVFAKTSGKWKLWKCGSCSKEFRRSAECKKHLEQEHAMKFRPSLKSMIPKTLDEIQGEMIATGAWEPVDTKAAVEIIKNQSLRAKGFVYVNGWSKDWPLSDDEGCKNILKKLHQSLNSLLEQKLLSRSIWDRLIRYAVETFELLGVPQHYLDDCGLVNTPQLICFLECHQLEHMDWYLKRIIPTDYNTDLLSKAVDGFYESSRVKERINFDDKHSCLLLDRRLLRGKIVAFDDEGTVDVCSSGDHYARVSPQGDEIVSWLLDCPSIDEEPIFHRPIKEHNLDIWLAVLRIVDYRCWHLETIYKEKLEMLAYVNALREAEELCSNEDEQRRHVPQDQWKTYASILLDKCQDLAEKDDENSTESITFLSAVRDTLEGVILPRFGGLACGDHASCISKHSFVSDDFVLISLERLRTVSNNELLMIDPKFLRVENSRSQLLNDLTRLSVFDYRSYILPLLKRFLRKELFDMMAMDVKTRSVAAEAALLSEIEQEKKKSLLQQKKKKKKKKKNKCCRKEEDNMVFDHKSEINPSIRHESDLSRSIAELTQTEEEEHLERVSSEDKVSITEDGYRRDESSSASGQLKHAFKVEDQKETTIEVTQSKPGSASLEKKEASDLKNYFQPNNANSSTRIVSASEDGDTRYDSALDMILRSLWNIRLLREELVNYRSPAHNHLEDQCVLCALRDLFSAFIEQINDAGLYHYLLNDLLIALKVTHPMAKGATELLVPIFEFLRSWKSPYRESLEKSLFTLEEFERMSCNRCRRKPNYPEQSSCGLVISANSLREIKYAFGDIKFENILKVIQVNLRMFCDKTKGGCGKRNYVHHTLTRFPAIFTVVLEWENNETEEEISATTTVLGTQIDMGVLYKGVNPLTKYSLASMVGCRKKEYNCIAYENERWVGYNPSIKVEIGDWKDVLGFCRKRKVRPEILFFESTCWPLQVP